MIWATRGRAWGFRFLLDGGFEDPLIAYSEAFSGIEDEVEVLRRRGDVVALRFLDPEGRRDRAGRPIAHDIVVFEGLAGVTTAAEGRAAVWRGLEARYAEMWDGPPGSSGG